LLPIESVAVVSAVGLVVGFVGCAEVPMPTSLSRQPVCPLTLGPEDILTIRVFDEPELTGDYQADTNGNIDFPFVGRLDIRGKTNTALADDISKELRDRDLILEPQVSVLIKEHNSARVLVDGKVGRPGSFPFRTGMTLLEAIGLAGGMDPIANQRMIQFTRSTGGGTNTEQVPIRAIRDGREPDIRLCPGDSIYVPESVL
jgi:polysaccharide export outer membrane protein